MTLWFPDKGPKHWGQLDSRINHIKEDNRWCGSDSQERFEHNWKNPETQARLIELGYDDNPDCITYRFNYQGFRCDEFDDRPAGMAIGCSHVMGTGNREHETWPHILSQLMGIHIWNLGIGATGLDTQFRIIDFYARLLKPKFIVHGIPEFTRTEVFARGTWFPILPDHYHHDEWRPYWRDYFVNDENSQVNAKRNIMAIKHICQQINIPYYAMYSGFDDEDLGTARDLMHYGPKSNRKFANRMHDLILTDPTGDLDDYTRISCS